MYALDTITVLDYFKCKGGVGAKLLAVPPGEAALPAVVAYEVWVGILGSHLAGARRDARYAERARVWTSARAHRRQLARRLRADCRWHWALGAVLGVQSNYFNFLRSHQDELPMGQRQPTESAAIR
jgi:hypothetical protein